MIILGIAMKKANDSISRCIIDQRSAIGIGYSFKELLYLNYGNQCIL
jgi:hypothetical protein